VPPVRIALPEGTIVNSKQPDVHRTLSNVLKREVTLSALSDRRAAAAEEYWPDIEGLDHRDAEKFAHSFVPSCSSPKLQPRPETG
jgi:uncharacterized protein